LDETTKEIVERLTRLIGEGRDYDEDTEAMIASRDLIESLSERVGELETKLLNSGCPNCNPSKLHAILGDPAKGVSLNARALLDIKTRIAALKFATSMCRATRKATLDEAADILHVKAQELGDAGRRNCAHEVQQLERTIRALKDEAPE
jgi:hypothetical protein